MAYGYPSLKPPVPPNNAPTGLALSTATVAENEAAGTVVGTFSTTDDDTGDTHAYTLVSGAGDTDNASLRLMVIRLRRLHRLITRLSRVTLSV